MASNGVSAAGICFNYFNIFSFLLSPSVFIGQKLLQSFLLFIKEHWFTGWSTSCFGFVQLVKMCVTVKWNNAECCSSTGWTCPRQASNSSESNSTETPAISRENGKFVAGEAINTTYEMLWIAMNQIQHMKIKHIFVSCHASLMKV